MISIISKWRKYVDFPESWRREKCGVHVFLHGCKQSAEWIGTGLIEKTGFHRWADTNNLIILYPQAHAFGEMKDVATVNLMRCWDWWRSSHDDYYSQNAPQMKAIIAMINRIKEHFAIL